MEWLTTNGLVALEVIGVIAFAFSGLIEAARKNADIVGVALISFVTAFGGGTLRDLLLDRRPFFWAGNEAWIWLILLIAVIVPLLFRAQHIDVTERAMKWPDALGLGVYAASGTQIALLEGESWLIASLMGVATAVFGGIIRDVLVNEIPRALNDHQFYAVIAFGGSILVPVLQFFGVEAVISVLLAAAVMIAVRFVAILFNWKLPAWRLE